MATIKIPESEYAVLGKIAELQEPAFLALVKAIDEADTNFIPLNFSDRLAPLVPTTSPADIKEITRTLRSLYAVMDGSGKTAAELADDVKATIETEKPKNFKSEKAEILNSRLKTLLGIGKIMSISAKAMDVMTEQDHVFCKARVLSDIRPVFGKSEESVSAAIIIHQLRISYHHEGKHKEFSVAMNPDDIAKFKEVLERADKKTKSLKDYIRKMGISYFEDKE